MAITLRRKILAELVDRVALIQTANGYETDAGLNVSIGDALELGKDDPDVALLVAPGDAVKRVDGKKKFVEFLVEIQALVKVGVTNAWIQVEAMLGDIEKAVESDPERRLAGQPLEWMSTRTLERQPGSQTAGVGVTYLVTYGQTWGAP